MADVAADLKTWSTTAASNSPADATTVGSGLADNLQEIQKVVRQDLAHKGADIASAGTTDLGAVVGLMHDITGTTTITSFGTVSAGIWKFIKFEGALTLTHNATSLILPGAANITTANGDTAIVMSEGSGNWRCLQYTKASGLPVIIPGMVLLATGGASGLTIDITTGMSSAYDDYVLKLNDIDPVTNAVSMSMRLSEDGGSNFISSGYNYVVNAITAAAPSTLTGAGSDSTSEIVLTTGALSNSALASGTIEIYAANSTNSYITWRMSYVSSASSINSVWGSGRKTGSAASNAVRLFLSGGSNFTAGTVRLYGMRK